MPQFPNTTSYKSPPLTVPRGPRAAGQTLPIDTGRRKNPVLRHRISTQTQASLQQNFYTRRGKRLLDLALAIPALVIALIPLLLIGLMIRLESKGPAIFTQERTGQFGRRFKLYKFRSMIHGAEDLKNSLQDQNVHGEQSPDFKVLDDPRVTRLGKLLRKTSIDELPNLINVVKGDMSLVGPRPTSFDSSTYKFEHLPRLSAVPGITGLWQVSGRANIDFDQRSRLDTEYIKRIGFLSDIALLVKTVTSNNEGAY